MRVVFQQELSEVQSRLVELAGGARTIMQKASGAFLNSDVSMADEALALADSHEEKALDLDELVIKILATQSPVAKDLRIGLGTTNERKLGAHGLPRLSHRRNCPLPLPRHSYPRCAPRNI